MIGIRKGLAKVGKVLWMPFKSTHRSSKSQVQKRNSQKKKLLGQRCVRVKCFFLRNVRESPDLVEEVGDVLSTQDLQNPSLSLAISKLTTSILGNEPELDPIWGNLRSLSEADLEKLAMEHAPSNAKIESAHVLRYAEGANNRVVIIQYEPNKTKCCIRIPACGWGDKWTETDKVMLERSARTMRYVKSHTAMPIPNIVHYNVELNNTISAPYMIMEYIEGQAPLKLWWGDIYDQPPQSDSFDSDSSSDSEEDDEVGGGEGGPEVAREEMDFQNGFHYKKISPELEQKRQRILESLASCVAELRSLKFDKLGTLSLDGSDGSLTVEPIISQPFGQVERDANFFRNLPTPEQSFDSSRAWLDSCLTRFCEDVFSRVLAKELSGYQSDLLYGMLRLYRLILDCLPLPNTDETEIFVIAPPDFGSQNILVDEEGNVTAILDWDRVDTRPQCSGWNVPPDWLFHDWFGPDCYAWPNRSMTPDEHTKYREDYAHYLREACGTESDDWKYATKSHIYDLIIAGISSLDYDRMLETLISILASFMPRMHFRDFIKQLGAARGNQMGEEMKEFLIGHFMKLFGTERQLILQGDQSASNEHLSDQQDPSSASSSKIMVASSHPAPNMRNPETSTSELGDVDKLIQPRDRFRAGIILPRLPHTRRPERICLSSRM
jgi:hypothetical protein